MKNKLLLLMGFLVTCMLGHSQTTMNLTLFSEDGDAFYVFVNGVKQNISAETHVKLVNQLTSLNVRIEFENKNLQTLKQNMSLDANREHIVKIGRDKKNKLKLRYSGSVAITETAHYPTPETYHTAEEAPLESNSNSDNHPVDPGFNTAYITDPSTTVQGTYSIHPISNTKYAMNEGGFLKMKESIESKSFSDTKMSTAKVALQNSYLSVNQIKIIAGLFSMDEDRLDYAKYAYEHCVDKANYYQVGDVFKFSFTVDELNAFLQH
ncbi:hypothetical protein CNR22_14415 [Sphingobacteriaceae bacterium]|nr:hypothetical protein CNR22_14415 [Sphingobacteriaceae bacterium]